MEPIFHRISVRRYEKRPVEQEKITQILKAAMAAPSAGNQKPCEFFIVTDSSLLQQLAKVSPYAGCVRNAPVAIVAAYRTEGLKYPEYAEIDSSIAVEHIWLETDRLGLGGVWLGIAPIEDRMEKTEKLLGMRAGLRAFAIFPLGYPAESRPQEDRWDESRVHYL